MKLGVLQFFGWADRRIPLESVYARASSASRSWTSAGYDAVWLAEHHFSGFSVCPSVHMMATMAAARTSRMRIGTAVSLAPFYHPLRLAEEVALLDVLSGGRVNWGAGRGFSRVEFAAFGIPIEESAPALPRGGRHRAERLDPRAADPSRPVTSTSTNVEVLPKPLQQPHPPVWMAATSESRHRLGGRPRLLDPDGPALHLRGTGRQAPPLRRADWPPPAIRRRRPRHPDGAADRGRRQRRARGRGGRPPRRRAGRSGPISAAAPPAHGPSAVAARPGAALRRRSDPARHAGVLFDQIQALQETAQLNYLLCAPLSQESFTLLTDRVLPKVA